MSSCAPMRLWLWVCRWAVEKETEGGAEAEVELHGSRQLPNWHGNTGQPRCASGSSKPRSRRARSLLEGRAKVQLLYSKI